MIVHSHLFLFHLPLQVCHVVVQKRVDVLLLLECDCHKGCIGESCEECSSGFHKTERNGKKICSPLVQAEIPSQNGLFDVSAKSSTIIKFYGVQIDIPMGSWPPGTGQLEISFIPISFYELFLPNVQYSGIEYENAQFKLLSQNLTQFGPAGTTFSSPIKVTLPFNASARTVNQTSVTKKFTSKIEVWILVNGKLRPLGDAGETLPITMETKSNQIQAHLNHFLRYAVVEIVTSVRQNEYKKENVFVWLGISLVVVFLVLVSALKKCPKKKNIHNGTKNAKVIIPKPETLQ